MTKTHPHTDRILRVVEYIHAHASEDLSLDQLADVAALSRFHWHRVFTAIMGVSPAAMIRSVRMHKATMLLVRSSQPVSGIAKQVGYPNERSFVRAFKEVYDVTPAAFRKRGVTAPMKTNPNGETLMFDVSNRTIDPMTLAALSHRGPYSEGSVAYQKVATIMTTGGHWPNTRGMAGVYYDDPNEVAPENLRSHAGVIWAGGEVPEGLEAVDLAGGDYAVLTFKGPYAGLGQAYDYLFGDWLTESQARLRDSPSFEVYLNDPTTTAPDDLLTEIFMPLAD
ncbi:AraC family transcriptional regulator [Octadecabacter sp. CECT 8868]|uniref:AraC family transcriptional regulator n=1 Tax=Octadecabacter algicola TaxID=2909342 RepID=UPI001F2EA552|nr:AraC family transcriptional regulator [Octadecabacter algicola]MCF2904759.1 AraC family transcriptional regulator [Octadecabacter algicola]